jgi:hypothetical protein
MTLVFIATFWLAQVNRTKLPEFYNNGEPPQPINREREHMPVTDCRSFFESLRSAARKSFEFEAKGTFRTTADDLSSIARNLSEAKV